ncbi:MAG TPA: PIN domain-containing protein [Gemmatimonadaceae bacterium]
MQQRLYLRPEPQGQRAFRETGICENTGCDARSATKRSTESRTATRLFVETSGWYALIDRRDAWHANAAQQVATLLDARGRLVTTDYVVDESCTLARARAGCVAANRLLDVSKQTGALDWGWIGAERFARAEVCFRKHSDHGYSFTDCTSFVVMRELKLARVLANDAHFTQAGFEPTLS